MARTLPPALQPYRDYLTYYMLKTNYAGDALPNYPMMDIAFLPSMVLQAAGLPKDPYFSALHELRTRCNGCTTTARCQSWSTRTTPGRLDDCTSTIDGDASRPMPTIDFRFRLACQRSGQLVIFKPDQGPYPPQPVGQGAAT